MAELELAAIAFNKPRLIAEQIRLLRKHLRDDFAYTVFDNSSDETAAAEIERLCRLSNIGYRRAPVADHAHGAALQFAWAQLEQTGAPFLGVVDHDIFPARPTRVVPFVREAGFFGVGQRHAPTGNLYLWPGFCFFSRDWLAGRPVDFGGIRGPVKADDGDTGSAMWPLFADADWEQLYRIAHSYKPIRKPDSFGLQSWGYETLGDWLHLSNGSGWMVVPNAAERDGLLLDLIRGL